MPRQTLKHIPKQTEQPLDIKPVTDIDLEYQAFVDKFNSNVEARLEQPEAPRKKRAYRKKSKSPEHLEPINATFYIDEKIPTPPQPPTKTDPENDIEIQIRKMIYDLAGANRTLLKTINRLTDLSLK